MRLTLLSAVIITASLTACSAAAGRSTVVRGGFTAGISG